MSVKIFIVQLAFEETLMDYYTTNHKAFFNRGDAEKERSRVEEEYLSVPECPLFEGEEEYLDRRKWGMTTPDEDEAMRDWWFLQDRSEGFSKAFIKELEVH